MTSVRLTDKQKKKIKESNLTASEFVRRAIDYYILYIENPYNDLLLFELEQWIKTKRVTGVTKDNTDVLNNSTDVTHNNTNVTTSNTDVTNISTQTTQNNTNVLQSNENNKTTATNNTKNSIKKILINELEMIQRLLNNPENAETIPDYTLKILSKRHDVSKSTIQAFIVENKDLLKNGEFEQIH